MKKVFFAALFAVSALFTAKADNDERPITLDKLPAPAQSFLKTNFSNLTFAYAIEEVGFFGNEYEKIRREMDPWRDHFAALTLGPPLLGGTGDLRQLAQVLSAAWPAQEDEALVLFGHGTDHFANVMYAALQTVFHIQGRTDVLVGTVEGWPAYQEVSAQLRRSGRRKVRLVPLMLVAGDHALNDMAGPEDSWRTRLEAEGYCVRCEMQGLGQLQGVQEMYRRHLEQALRGETADEL